LGIAGWEIRRTAAEREIEMSAVPHPPFPNPDSQILKLIVNNAIGAMQSGEVDAEGAILHAAVHAWYEGHIEGEDVCPGCDFRGDMPPRDTE
jgi:hypothetical protein